LWIDDEREDREAAADKLVNNIRRKTRKPEPLTSAFVKSLKEPGRYHDSKDVRHKQAAK